MDNSTPEKPHMKDETKKLIFSIFLIGLVVFFIYNNLEDKKEDSVSSIEKKEVTIDSVKENWNLSIHEDKMDNNVYRTAFCTSKNTVELNFPYNGGTNLEIWLRNGLNGQGNEVFLIVNKGQFMSSFDGEETVRMKFDNSPPISSNFSNESTGKSTTIFLSKSSSIIKRLKKSKKLIIEVDFYDNGTSQFEFDVEGLKWDIKNK
ncbi:hypothetical protein [Aquirufa nivalisilvae]|uniref:hypothetical protein n=1 Tax=Aquirufa nivalisilvae TaxID=2516557 RepID=UPI00103285C7|nr:hypothetical protein [Aquirufa nivalisilvae]TBH74901.1 hypothetical protein EWU22_05375 [Aquirufa nivalisilvae]